MKFILFAAVISFAFSIAASAQYYPAPPAIDQSKEPALLSILEQSPSPAQRIRALLDLSNLYFNKPLKRNSDLARSLRLASEALALCRKEGDKARQMEALLMMADLYSTADDLPAAEKILNELDDTSRLKLLLNLSFRYAIRDRDSDEEDYRKSSGYAARALDLAKRLGDAKSEIMALRDAATVHLYQQKPATENQLLEVIARYRLIGYPLLHYTYELLAEYHHAIGNPDKALYYSLEMLKSMKRTGDSIAAGDFYIIHAAILSNNDEFQQAIEYAALAAERYKEHAGKFNLSYPMVANVTAHALRKSNKYVEALAYTLNMMKNYPPQNSRDSIDYLSMIGGIYRADKEFTKAEPFFLQALSISNRAHVRTANSNGENSQNRIYAMSLVHQKLYQSNDITTVDMSLFFSDFLHFLAESFDLGNRIKIVQDVQPVKLNISRAITLALILNEGVTNAIKYAFPGNGQGIISVSLQRLGRQMQLVIADNGIGMKEVPHTEYNSLGIELMKGLSDEIGAEIHFEVENGTKIVLKANAEAQSEQDNIHKVAV